MRNATLVLLLLLTACGATIQTQGNSTNALKLGRAEDKDTSDIQQNQSLLHGKEVYEQTCIACHGSDGTGMFRGIPDLTKIPGFRSKSDSDSVLLAHVVHVRKGLKTPGSLLTMPANGGNPNLTEEDVKHVLFYMRSRFSRE